MGSTYTYSTFSYSIVVRRFQLQTHGFAYLELKEINKVLDKINIPVEIMILIQNIIFWNLVEEKQKNYLVYNNETQSSKVMFEGAIKIPICNLVENEFELSVGPNLYLHKCCDYYHKTTLKNDVLDKDDEYAVFNGNDPYVSCQN